MDPILPIKDLMAKQYPAQKWLVDKLIPASGITILSAEPGSYKTYLLLEAALAVVSGRPLFGQFDTTKTGVLMIDMENGEALLQQRLRELGTPDNEDLPIYFASRREFTVDKENIELAILNCKAYDVGLLMIDSLVRVHQGDENTAGDMAKVFEMLRQIADEGIAVLITHHNRKPGSNVSSGRHEMRGSSDILAAVDCHIALRRKEGKVTVEQTKLRVAKELNPFTLAVEGDEKSVKFSYVNGLESQVSNDKQLEIYITGLLRKHGRLSQKELIEKIANLGFKTNEHKVREVLNYMIGMGQIRVESGAGNTKVYVMVEEVQDE